VCGIVDALLAEALSLCDTKIAEYENVTKEQMYLVLTMLCMFIVQNFAR